MSYRGSATPNMRLIALIKDSSVVLTTGWPDSHSDASGNECTCSLVQGSSYDGPHTDIGAAWNSQVLPLTRELTHRQGSTAEMEDAACYLTY